MLDSANVKLYNDYDMEKQNQNLNLKLIPANFDDLEKEWLFVKEMPEDEIYLRVNKDNPASLNVMLKNGGRIVGENKEKYFVRIKK